MSKIIQAVNVMITNKDEITDVQRNEDSFFFLYKNIYKWMITPSNDSEDYFLRYFPSETIDTSIEELSNMDYNDWMSIKGRFVSYDTDELKTVEARESFSELYLVVKEKFLGVDDALQDIIDDGPLF